MLRRSHSRIYVNSWQNRIAHFVAGGNQNHSVQVVVQSCLQPCQFCPAHTSSFFVLVSDLNSQNSFGEPDKNQDFPVYTNPYCLVMKFMNYVGKTTGKDLQLLH